jgi:alanine racemase
VPRAQAWVDLAAIEANVAHLRVGLRAPAQVCAVVKADGYGHGAVPSARAALAGGATWLGVATGREAMELHEAGIRAPILAMGALDAEELELALAADADVGAWSERFVARLGDRPARVHVKLDTGLGRLDTRDTHEADALVATLGERAMGLWTHFATADALGDAFFDEQLERFRVWAARHQAANPRLLVHAANSAAALLDPAAHFDLVRCGGAMYGMDPFGEDAAARDLRPALELLPRGDAQALPAGPVGGLRPTFRGSRADAHRHPADRLWRRLAPRAERQRRRRDRGRRHPLVGTISMDNVTVDVGLEADVRSGDPAVLIGAGITVEEVARLLGTINYEVTTGLLPRTQRAYHRDGVPA